MRFCNVPQAMTGRHSMGMGLCQWPVGHEITWNVVAPVPGFSVQSCQEIYAASFDRWDAVCGMAHRYVSNPRSANILMGVRQIDGPAGVLAEAELPCGNVHAGSQLRLWMDSSDRWTTAENWQGSGRFPMQVVSLHEIGHNLGLGHDHNERVGAIMDPSIGDLRELQPADIEQAQMRYGEQTPPPVDDDEDDSEVIRLLADCLRRLTAEDKKLIRSFLTK